MVRQITTDSRDIIEISQAIVSSIKRALEEDIGSGDATTNSIIPATTTATARVVAKQNGVVSGIEVARTVYLQFDDPVRFDARISEGTQAVAGQTLVELSGSARTLLTGERTALNFLGRMSGIATLTRQFVTAVSSTGAIILDTRKTAPGLRDIDKLAVLHGGGQNHRRGLYDMVLIKDNHIDAAGSLSEAVRRARAATSGLEIEVEARTINDVGEALSLGVERILLDNMTSDQMREAVRLNAGRAKLEASGNVTLENVRSIAETGIDFISVGALTHSAKVFDASLQWGTWG
jgi:nicotinate-nucleotide pyrophosphorylase (carboxylating)